MYKRMQHSLNYSGTRFLSTDFITCPLILLLVITLSLDDVLILLGEHRCWSILGLKGFNNEAT